MYYVPHLLCSYCWSVYTRMAGCDLDGFRIVLPERQEVPGIDTTVDLFIRSGTKWHRWTEARDARAYSPRHTAPATTTYVISRFIPSKRVFILRVHLGPCVFLFPLSFLPLYTTSAVNKRSTRSAFAVHEISM